MLSLCEQSGAGNSGSLCSWIIKSVVLQRLSYSVGIVYMWVYSEDVQVLNFILLQL